MSTVGPLRLVVGLVAVAVAFAAPALGQTPRPGTVQWLTAISVSVTVASTDKESRQVTYTPPPGWYVRSHRVVVGQKLGNASYTVSTIPQDWGWMSEEKLDESYRSLIDLAGKAGNHGLQAKFAAEREAKILELRRVRASHHALVVDATVRGEGFLRAKGALDLVVLAELVYVGTDDDLERTVARHRASLTK